VETRRQLALLQGLAHQLETARAVAEVEMQRIAGLAAAHQPAHVAIGSDAQSLSSCGLRRAVIGEVANHRRR
jgi:hypothetical protein